MSAVEWAPGSLALERELWARGSRSIFAVESHMMAAIRIQTVLVALVVLNLIALTIAAYRIMRRK